VPTFLPSRSSSRQQGEQQAATGFKVWREKNKKRNIDQVVAPFKI